MKRKKVVLLFFVSMFLLSFIYLKRQHSGINSELILSNIEALASGEDSGNYYCFGIGSIDCPFHSTKVYYVSK